MNENNRATRSIPYRQHRVLLIALSSLSGAVTAGAMMTSLGIGGSVRSGLIGLIGTLVGSGISFGAVAFHDDRRQANEIKAMEASLYAEIVDRVARCANDYIKPWRNFTRRIESEDAKFLPSLPLVLPAVAGKLGLLDAEILLAVTQFYFRLSVLRDAIELVSKEPKTSEEFRLQRVEMIQKRLLSCFGPALRSMELLGVADYKKFDQEAVRVYPHLKEEPGDLRQIIKRFADLAAEKDIV
ncbi:hypothetical protein [Bradyrhizobium genosp. P]|uniref:hypothetical protein n=1 Tax=Bradyrhizobium genosp. P TaxID=83641 RepID=UPI003CEE5DCF